MSVDRHIRNASLTFSGFDAEGNPNGTTFFVPHAEVKIEAQVENGRERYWPSEERPCIIDKDADRLVGLTFTAEVTSHPLLWWAFLADPKVSLIQAGDAFRTRNPLAWWRAARDLRRAAVAFSEMSEQAGERYAQVR